MPPPPIAGLHHVTGIASDPQRNLDFYTDVLGLRFVKRTVNFDDPGTYHFYFGDDTGSPGTILTFFTWPRVAKGLSGAGSITHIAFLVPQSSLSYWRRRLSSKGVTFEHQGKRFEEEVLALTDPDGIKLEIVGRTEVPKANASRFSDVPPQHAIRGLFGVALLERNAVVLTKLLKAMGFQKIAAENNRSRFSSASDVLGNFIDLVIDADAVDGFSGTGTVHHLAFRAFDDAFQMEWRTEIAKYLDISNVIDRDYFRSIYFREPGGVLLELATDLPGFTCDEPIECLGESLCVPEWLEPSRSLIEERLTAITLHKVDSHRLESSSFHYCNHLWKRVRLDENSFIACR